MTSITAPSVDPQPATSPGCEAAPSVSIGMPVFNAERTLRQALQSIVDQSHTNFELHISDNASTDGTAEICVQFAQRDRRIRYHRQERNIGAAANFRYVLDRAQAPYFMWAAADDVRSPDYLACNLAFLEQNPDVVLCTSPTRFEDGSFDPVRMGDASLDGPLAQRLRHFFRTWHANGRFYAVMRLAPLQSCPVVDAHFLGSDWAVVLHMIGQGKTHRLEQGWTVLGARGVSRGKSIFQIYRTRVADVCMPFHQLSRFAWQCAAPVSTAHKIHLAMALLRLNAMAFIVQFLVRWR